MEAAALQHIEKLVLDAHGKHLLTELMPAIILNGQVQPIEYLMAGRARFRGTFSTSVLQEYVAYLTAHPGGHGFIDPEGVTATTFLNLGTESTPGHADWRAVLALKPTAAYAALLKVEGQQLDQRSMAEWIEDWADLIGGELEEQAVRVADIVAAVREVTISASRESTTVERDLGASRSAMEQIEARGKKGLPSVITFETTPYVGFSPRTFRLRLSVITSDKPKLVLRVIGKEAELEDIANEFKTRLTAGIGDSATMILGKFQP